MDAESRRRRVILRFDFHILGLPTQQHELFENSADAAGSVMKRKSEGFFKGLLETMISLEELAVRLFDAGAVRLGDIEAKIGRRTPIYFDLRVVVSHPQVMLSVTQHLEKLARGIEHDLLCGVPYAALPLAAVMSVNTNTPMIMKRKETKMYATKRILEGIFEKNQNCLVVEDVVTSGGSLMETVGTLRSEGLIVTNAVVVLDRDQGGASVLKQNGIQVKSIFTLTELLRILNEAGKINDETVEIILDHIKECQFSNSDFMKDNLELMPA